MLLDVLFIYPTEREASKVRLRLPEGQHAVAYESPITGLRAKTVMVLRPAHGEPGSLRQFARVFDDARLKVVPGGAVLEW